MVDGTMVEVKTYLNEMALFVKTVKSEQQVVELITGWEFPENSEAVYPFLASETVTVNSGSVTLADVVERQMANVKCGEEVTVILADNSQRTTKMEYFKCKVPSDSTLSAVDIVNQATVRFYEGENYYDEDIL